MPLKRKIPKVNKKNFLVLVNKLSDENLEISIYSKTGAYE